jgi:hypothetical protein
MRSQSNSPQAPTAPAVGAARTAGRKTVIHGNKVRPKKQELPPDKVKWAQPAQRASSLSP